jgi:hypothetical protein
MPELFPITAEMRLCFKENFQNNAESLQKILLLLNQKGVSQMQSVKLLMEEMKMSLADADKIVLNSNAWASEFEDNKIFRENFFNLHFRKCFKN